MAGFITDHQEICQALAQIHTIALLGASPNTERASNRVMQGLLTLRYNVIPINPGQVGKTICDQPVFAKLTDITETVEMVDVFRNSEAMPEIVKEILLMPTLPKILWMQLGVIHQEAAEQAIKAGINVIMDRCPLIELGVH